MAMRLARYLAMYGLGISIALAAVNLFTGEYDWAQIIIYLVLSGGIYYYIDFILEPQIKAKQAELDAQKVQEEQEKPRRRPKLKKQS